MCSLGYGIRNLNFSHYYLSLFGTVQNEKTISVDFVFGDGHHAGLRHLPLWLLRRV